MVVIPILSLTTVQSDNAADWTITLTFSLDFNVFWGLMAFTQKRHYNVCEVQGNYIEVTVDP